MKKGNVRLQDDEARTLDTTENLPETERVLEKHSVDSDIIEQNNFQR